jgi:hypothetical protein
MPGKIFVNYRRDDARDMAARIRDRLAATFGAANVFMDVDDLLAGQRFDTELEKALDETDVFLCVIGSRWTDLLAARQASGEHDYVREEIAGALQRGIIVIPVLIERTPLPRASRLPQDIRGLVLHQTHEIAHARFGRDVAELVEAIRLIRKAARVEAGGKGTVVRWIGAFVLAALVLGGSVLAYQRGASDRGVEARGEGKAAAENARLEERKRAAEAAAAKRAEEEAQAKRAAEEAERQRLAMLKVEEERKRAAAAKRVEEEAQAKRAAEEAERQRLAMEEREEERKRAETISAKQAAEAAKKKADDDARLETAAAKRRAEEEARAKRVAEEAAEHQRLAKLQQEEKQKSGEVDKSASVGNEKGHKDAARCVARARAMLKNVGGPSAIAMGATDCGYYYGPVPGGIGSREVRERWALRNCRRKTTGCRIVD